MATQKEIGAHLDLDERQIRNLMTSQPGAPKAKRRGEHNLDEWRLFYIRYLRDMGKGKNVGQVDPDQEDDYLRQLKREKERAALDDKLESIAMKRLNRKIKEGVYAPIDILTLAISSLMVAVNSRMEGMLPRLKQAWPDMPVEAYQALEKEKVAISNELSESEPDLSAYVEIDQEGGAEGDVGS